MMRVLLLSAFVALTITAAQASPFTKGKDQQPIMIGSNVLGFSDLDVAHSGEEDEPVVSNKRMQHQHNWGVGVRLGDPTGLTVKKYLNNGRALEMSAGVSRWYRGSWYLARRYVEWYLDNSFTYYDFQHTSTRSSTPISLQLNYMIHKPIGHSGFSWYVGGGVGMNYRTYTFNYRYRLDANANWVEGASERIVDIDIGVLGVSGFEHSFKNAPVSLFFDTSLMIEFFNNFSVKAYGGLGCRYNF